MNAVRRRLAAWVILPLASMTWSCTENATQLLVVVDSDLAVPQELSFVRAYSRADDGRTSASLEYDLARGDAVLPFSFGIEPFDGDAERGITVFVEGFESLDDDEPAVERRAHTGFVEGETRLLEMYLARVCKDDGASDCRAEQTCGRSGCVSAEVPASSLPTVTPGDEFDGRDGGVSPPADGGDVPMRPDAGSQNCALALGGAPERLEWSASTSFSPNVPLLAGDFDRDGVSEILAVRVGNPSELALIDFEGCDRPVVTSSASFGEIVGGPVWVPDGPNAGLWVLERRALRVWDVSDRTLTQRRSPLLSHEDAAYLAANREATSIGAVVLRQGQWGFLHTDRDAAFLAFHAVLSNLRAQLASLGGDRFVSASSAEALDSTVAGGARSLAPVNNLRDPVSIDDPFGDGTQFVVGRTESQLVIVREPASGGNATVQTVNVGQELKGEPVPIRRNNEVRIFLIEHEDSIVRCRLEADGRCPVDASDRFRFSGEENERGGLLTAYVDDDDWPDVIMMTKNGALSFRSGSDLTTPAAPTVSFGRESESPSGVVLPDFFDAFGIAGTLLVVPTGQGRLEFVGWRRPVSAPLERTWPQHRGGPERSANR